MLPPPSNHEPWKSNTQPILTDSWMGPDEKLQLKQSIYGKDKQTCSYHIFCSKNRLPAVEPCVGGMAGASPRDTGGEELPGWGTIPTAGWRWQLEQTNSVAQLELLIADRFQVKFNSITLFWTGLPGGEFFLGGVANLWGETPPKTSLQEPLPD